MSEQQPLPPVPQLCLDDLPEDSDSDSSSEDDSIVTSADIKRLLISSTSTSSSSLSPSTAYAVRKPQQQPPPPPPPQATTTTDKDGFKVPLPPSTTSPSSSSSTAADRDAKLNAFPALNGPQRAGVLGSARRKVPLEPGHSPLDWARLLTSGKNLRGVPQLARYTLADVAAHRKRDDCWMSIQGKVYNVTHYMKFHPGGAGQLMRGAGKDATELFMKVHPWVNVDTLLDKCQVGYLVKDNIKPDDS